MSCVPGKPRSIQIEIVEPRRGEKPPLGQDGVERRARMPLAEKEAIPLGPAWALGVNPQYFGVEHSQQIGHGEGRADMGTFRAMNHVQRLHTNSLGEAPGIDIAPIHGLVSGIIWFRIAHQGAEASCPWKHFI